ncbi:MAG TPA: aquaporin [Acidobacteriota bacterium]|jgi:MIP family channel proteins|nr:aquaporin [Acidobacteriota bacterium]
MNSHLKPAIAELIGTFTLVFIGAGAVAMAKPSGGGIVAAAFAHGIALMVIVYTWGADSGAHVNPAVTFGLALTGKISWIKAAWYWGAQFVGGIVAALILRVLIGTGDGLGATIGTFTASDPGRTIAVEAILTFFLVIAVFGTAVAGRNGIAAGLAIGLVLTMDILMGGFLTGASMNPARTLGPAVALGDVSYVWLYFVGPLLGAAAGAFLYDRVILKS